MLSALFCETATCKMASSWLSLSTTNDAVSPPVPNYIKRLLKLDYSDVMSPPVPNCLIKRLDMVTMMLCLNTSKLPDQTSKLNYNYSVTQPVSNYLSNTKPDYSNVMSQPVPNYVIKRQSLITILCLNPFQIV